MTFRVEQTQAKQGIASGEESAPAQRSLAMPALVANPNPTWQRLSSATAPATGGALSAPSRVGAGLRTSNAPSRRTELALANAKLQALRDIAAQSVVSVDPEHREAIAAAFDADIAHHIAYCNTLTG